MAGHTVTLSAELTGETPQDSPVVRLSWDDPELTLSDILEAVGELPIPPYLNRPTEESDRRDYQTVYSKIDGSVAAPTAGLHFTPEVLRAIDAELDKGTRRVTIHLPYDKGGWLDSLYREAKVESVEYGETIDIVAVCTPRVLGRVKDYVEGYTEPKEDWE